MTLMPVSNSSVLLDSSENFGGVAVDGPALGRRDGAAAVDRLAEEVEHAAEDFHADGHADRRAGVDDLHAADQAVGRAQRDGADAVAAEVLLDLAGQLDASRP